MARRSKRSDRSANDRAFLNGFQLGHMLGQREIARALENEFRERAEEMRVKCFRIINKTRELVGLPPEPDDERPTTLQ